MSREERSDRGTTSEVGGKPERMMLWKSGNEYVGKGGEHDMISVLSQIRAEAYLWGIWQSRDYW